MAPTIVQSWLGNSNAGTSVSQPGSWATPSAGNLLIAWCRSDATAEDGSISGWTKAVSVDFYGGRYAYIFYKISDGSESAFSFSSAGASNCHIGAEEWSAPTASPLDKTAATADTGGAVGSRSTGTTAATTVADELLIALVAWGGTITAGSLAWTNSFSKEGEYPAAAPYLGGGAKVVSSTGAQESTASWTTNRRAGAAIATFKYAGGTLYYGTPAGALSSIAGGLIKETDHSLSASISSIVGTLAKKTAIPLTATISSIAGALSKITARNLVASIGSISGSLVRSISRALAGAITAIVGGLSMLTGRSLSGAIASIAGGITKRTGKPVAGSLSTISGTIVNEVGVTVAGVLSAITGGIAKKTGKPLGGSIAGISGALAVLKTVLQAVAGVLGSIVGSLSVILHHAPAPYPTPDISDLSVSEWEMAGGSDIDAYIPDQMHIEAMPCVEDAEVEQSLEIPSSLPAEPDLTGESAKEWELI